MDDRTEEATPRRRREAREKGQVAKSVEINSAVLMLTAFWLLNITGSRFSEGLSLIMRRTFNALPKADMTYEYLFSGASAVGTISLWMLAPFVGVLVVAGIVANMSQVGLLFTQKALQPDLNKINPVSGFKRLFSLRGLVDLIKSMLKVLIIGAVIYITLRDNYPLILSTARMGLSTGVSTLAKLGIEIGLRAGAIMVVIAVIDYVYQRYEHNKSLRMTKQEVKDEAKQYENPQLRSRIRSRQRQMAMSRMMASIPQADVVVTNPTHLAVALRYEQGKMQAPQVVAKGQRLVAERIKAKAREHNVPVVENKPLARTLYKSVEVGQSIPADLYKTVAQVLAFVYSIKRRRKAGQNMVSNRVPVPAGR